MLTVSSAVLDHLTVTEDDPLMLGQTLGPGPNPIPVYIVVHPLLGAQNHPDFLRLVFPQSRPTLLRGTARALGLVVEPADQVVLYQSHGSHWTLNVVTPSQEIREHHSLCLGPHDTIDRDVHVPTLQISMDPSRAAAELALWVARMKRLEKPGWDAEARETCASCGAYKFDAANSFGCCSACGNDAEWRSCTNTLADIAAVEDHLGLDRWSIL